ncbi:phenylalanine--tRNA ligase subunit beta [Piedraia hortae CBS 480.64]|uniref:phenylalanine--tRNA ligase n=1 Tax=Piedraia hortae CBS 480.64 TaxID=1314780 RepID=A0A6A7BSI7_9PEZI|nr:phenylalanine--tRNA ligase subunit beta [Piedraia hortae CBS 480.64]
MPTIAVDKDSLYNVLGREYSTAEFDELCFDFGLELDEDTGEAGEEPAQLKIEIPANRYDMLCFEGIAMNLNIFLGRQSMPKFSLTDPKETVTVSPDTARIRPYFSCAILRNIRFTQARYDSFIALQDKLHQNLARQRSLVAIGTHDLDTIEGPFTYEALPPDEISFAPLNQTKVMTATQMMDFYAKDKHLSKYLPIIRDSSVYPIIYDKNRTVLSMPPIINSNHSKITLNTRNVFIDITATDKTKLEIVNHILVSMFSQYCAEPFVIEPVKVVSDHNNETRITPDVSSRQMEASTQYLNAISGLKQSREEICQQLGRMAYTAEPSKIDEDRLVISVPITRADVLHEADVIEDSVVAYGFNKLKREFPKNSSCVAADLPLTRLSDIIRESSAMSGWVEVMPLTLCSHDENYKYLNRKSSGEQITLQNPKSAEYQIVRTSLLPGLLKTIRENRKHGVPMKIFEVADVVFKDVKAERRSRNERHFAACWYGKTSGFEQVHGLLDRIMRMLNVPCGKEGYWIEEVEADATFLPGHSASIHISIQGKSQRIGELGILHPTVLKNYELPFPTSTVEINIEPLL